ncbi:hypothetical protein AURDEDRAFT_168885 [Auricularia subglabra TFB-10046 SS5]|nr:hypothetical protein AURDEDRAFT_168885 [Auricularia subglabra TFB-10046 SS5]
MPVSAIRYIYLWFCATQRCIGIWFTSLWIDQKLWREISDVEGVFIDIPNLLTQYMVRVEYLDSATGLAHSDLAPATRPLGENTTVIGMRGVLKDQGKCLASLVTLQAESQRALEAIAEKFEVAPLKSTRKRRERRKRAFKPMVVLEVVQLEDKDKDEGPSRKRRRVEKAKPEVVASESEDEEAAETAKGKGEEKEKAPEGPVDETLQSD